MALYGTGGGPRIALMDDEDVEELLWLAEDSGWDEIAEDCADVLRGSYEGAEQ